MVQTSGTGERPARVESLTGLRWFAAFGVFAYHASQIIPLRYAGEVMRLGDAGVTFFYVLSGFVLTWSFSPRVTTRTFWWRRFARVWPMLALSIPIAWLFLAQDWREAWLPSIFGLTMVEAWLRPAAGLVANPVSWSVSCEVFFYLVFPFLVRPLLRLGLRGLAGVAALLIAVEFGYWFVVVRYLVQPGHPDYWVDLSWFLRFPPYRLAEFLLGVVVAAALLRGWRPRLNLWVALGSVAVSGALLIWGTRHGWWGDIWTQQGLLISFLLVIVAAARGDVLGRASFLRSRPLVTLGKWSYAFYLVHLSVIQLLGTDLFGILAPAEPLSWTSVVILAAWTVVATALAGLCYTLVEHPVEGWLRRLYPRARGTHRAVIPAPRTPVPAPAEREREASAAHEG